MDHLSKMRRLVERREPEPEYPYLDLVGDKCNDALRGANYALRDAKEHRDEVEKAWKDWDLDALVRLRIIDRDLAKKAKAEQDKQVAEPW